MRRQQWMLSKKDGKHQFVRQRSAAGVLWQPSGGNQVVTRILSFFITTMEVIQSPFVLTGSLQLLVSSSSAGSIQLPGSASCFLVLSSSSVFRSPPHPTITLWFLCLVPDLLIHVFYLLPQLLIMLSTCSLLCSSFPVCTVNSPPFFEMSFAVFACVAILSGYSLCWITLFILLIIICYTYIALLWVLKALYIELFCLLKCSRCKQILLSVPAKL